MAMISINSDRIDILAQSMSNQSQKLDPSVKSISNPSKCNGIMIFSYLDRIQNISKLISNYKSLLEKDVVDIRNSKNKIVEMDKNLTNLYKNSSGN